MSSKANTLARIRELRKAGKTGFSTYEVQEAEDLYETVDEEGYKNVVRKRLDQDDFVIDDNGAGYADDGREDWGENAGQDYTDESESELPTTTRPGIPILLTIPTTVADISAGKRKREEDPDKREKLKNGINKYFNTNNTLAATKPKVSPSISRS